MCGFFLLLLSLSRSAKYVHALFDALLVLTFVMQALLLFCICVNSLYSSGEYSPFSSFVQRVFFAINHQS